MPDCEMTTKDSDMCRVEVTEPMRGLCVADDRAGVLGLPKSFEGQKIMSARC